MTYSDAVGLAAALFIILGFAATTQKRLRVLVSLGSGLLLYFAVLIGSLPLLAVSVIVLILNLVRLRGLAGRKPTRTASDMDHDVHERIRKISAESRYSSAGYEF